MKNIKMKNILVCLLTFSLMLAASAVYTDYVGIGGSSFTPTHPLHIRASNPGTTPLEQAVIDNPDTTGAVAMSMLGLCGFDGIADACHSWVLNTSNSFTYAPWNNSLWLESDKNGIVLASDDASIGGVRIVTGCYTSVDCLRVWTDPTGLTHFYGKDGPTQGIVLEQTTNVTPTDHSYMAINLKSPAGLVGQFLSTAANYANSGALNLASSSVAFFAYLGNLTFGAVGNVYITTGGYDVAHTEITVSPGTVKVKSLSGTGIRPVCADASGNLQPCP